MVRSGVTIIHLLTNYKDILNEPGGVYITAKPASLENQIRSTSNPVVNTFSICTELNIKDVWIYNISGELVTNDITNLQNINISSFPKGIYFVKIILNDKNVIYKTIIKA